MTAQPVPGVTLKTAKANNIHMRYAEIGSGPLVLFCHGWPESWYSWRHQLTAVGGAGFRCGSADNPRYPRTQAPRPIHPDTPPIPGGDTGRPWKAPRAAPAPLLRPDPAPPRPPHPL